MTGQAKELELRLVLSPHTNHCFLYPRLMAKELCGMTLQRRMALTQRTMSGV
jgi:hypothetical protein